MAITFRRLRAATCALAAACALVVAAAPDAHALPQPTPAKTVGLSGDVVFDLTVLDSGRVILGGQFSAIGGYPRANLGAVLASGAADPGFAPTVNGPVRAVAVSDDGSRLFIGGTFTEVNGVPRHNLAALDASTGVLVDGWRADTVGATPTVSSLAVRGRRLFVGGRFDGIDGSAKQKLAAVDVTTGNLVSWNTWVNGAVNEVRVAPDGTVWVGGEFTRIHGIDRPYLGAIDPVTGQPTGFAAVGIGSRLITLAVSPDGDWVYAANNSNRTLAYAVTQSETPRWTRRTDGNVQAIVGSDTHVYLGGHYTSFDDDGTLRTFFAAVSRSTGAMTAWDPRATGFNKGCWALVIEGSSLHAGGGFTHFDGVRQRLYARFDGTP